MVKIKCLVLVVGNLIWVGGGGVIVEVCFWDNELLWSFECNNENECLYYDIVIIFNEMILMIVWEKKICEEVI